MKKWGESHDSREQRVSRDGWVFPASELVSGMIPHRRWEIQAVFAKTMSQPSSRPISICPPSFPCITKEALASQRRDPCITKEGRNSPPLAGLDPPGSRIRRARNRSARRAASSPLPPWAVGKERGLLLLGAAKLVAGVEGKARGAERASLRERFFRR